MAFLLSTCYGTSNTLLDILKNKNDEEFCLGGIFNSPMKHLENISYNQGAQKYNNYRNSKKWLV